MAATLAPSWLKQMGVWGRTRHQPPVSLTDYAWRVMPGFAGDRTDFVSVAGETAGCVLHSPGGRYLAISTVVNRGGTWCTDRAAARRIVERETVAGRHLRRARLDAHWRLDADIAEDRMTLVRHGRAVGCVVGGPVSVDACAWSVREVCADRWDAMARVEALTRE